MYYSFFHLKDEPSRLTNAPRFLHLAEPHQAALKVVLEGILYRKGLVMVTGPIGTGKTTVIHTAMRFISAKKTRISSALLFNPVLTRDEFLEMILEDFEVNCPSASKSRRLIAFQQTLLQTQRV